MELIKPIWKGQECWIIGGGASIPRQFGIPESIINSVIKGDLPPSDYSPYMKALHDRNVIGVNAAYLLGDWLDFVFFGDEKFWKNNKVELETNCKTPLVSCNTIFSGSATPQVLYVPKDKTKRFGITTSPGKVVWNGNSGAAAINFAVQLGCTRIYLLGFDMNQNPTNHWHGEYVQWQGTKPLSFQTTAFKEIARDAEGLDVTIINCSPQSAITNFVKKNVADVLKIENKEITEPQKEKRSNTMDEDTEIISDEEITEFSTNKSIQACTEYKNTLEREFSYVLAGQSIHINLWRAIKNGLNKTETIVELGCGTGLFAKFLLDNKYKYLTGIDFSGEAIKKAQKNNVRFKNRFVVDDIKNYEVPQGTDCVLILDTLQYIEEDLELLNNLPAGIKVIITVPLCSVDWFAHTYETKEVLLKRYEKVIDVSEFTTTPYTYYDIFTMIGVRK